jgi:F-type H+-transporting ATPase subunit alpha
LLERAARLSDEKGGGSITALPIIETQEGDVSGYIPTNVISITDGQMFLITDLFNKGIRPAIDVGISVSRVGSAAQTKSMKAVAGGLKLELAQFRDLEAFMQFASDLDKATADRIASGQRMVEVLKQKNGQPIALEKQVAMLFVAGKQFLIEVPVNKVTEVERLYLDYLDNQYSDALETIRKTAQLSDESKETLLKAADEFKLAHPELFTIKQ